ncbi:hypothetical protein POTOM_061892 [Populus tomentosa]|uniref:Tify domain-containing protein n=1 Tax=Populus tomentosa TaxID=118781 RepID=A0A8X8BV65_POPTO|nr:hypothetical protein POTOM_061892 [Populus tomentosa]
MLSSRKRKYKKISPRDQRLHRLVFEEGGLPDGTELAYYARGQKLLGGYKRGFGILCRCCNCEVSPSMFEAHAGWGYSQKTVTYAYIYTSNGVSLHELAISLSKSRKYSSGIMMTYASFVQMVGIYCFVMDCPRAFHKGPGKMCFSTNCFLVGDWYCQYCQNTFEREKLVEHNANASAAGRVSGVDSIEQITKRCFRIVKNIEAGTYWMCIMQLYMFMVFQSLWPYSLLDISLVVVLCRGYDFMRSGFGPRTIILCDQCEKEFHVGCLRSHKMTNLKELPKATGFAVWIAAGSILLCRSCSFECLPPIVDSTIGRDLIPLMVYGVNNQLKYCISGYTTSFGEEVAELPWLQRGMVNMARILCPAAEEAESIWTEKFGFQKIKPEQLNKYRKSCCQMVRLKGHLCYRKRFYL